jgi:hypothetical protein
MSAKANIDALRLPAGVYLDVDGQAWFTGPVGGPGAGSGTPVAIDVGSDLENFTDYVNADGETLVSGDQADLLTRTIVDYQIDPSSVLPSGQADTVIGEGGNAFSMDLPLTPEELAAKEAADLAAAQEAVAASVDVVDPTHLSEIGPNQGYDLAAQSDAAALEAAGDSAGDSFLAYMADTRAATAAEFAAADAQYTAARSNSCSNRTSWPVSKAAACCSKPGRRRSIC